MTYIQVRDHAVQNQWFLAQQEEVQRLPQEAFPEIVTSGLTSNICTCKHTALYADCALSWKKVRES